MTYETYRKAPLTTSLTFGDGTVVDYKKMPMDQQLKDDDREKVREHLKGIRDVMVGYGIDSTVIIKFNTDVHHRCGHCTAHVKGMSWVAPELIEDIEF